MAMMILRIPLNGATEMSIQNLDGLREVYDAGGVIDFFHLPRCQSNGPIFAMRDLSRGKGLSFLNIEADLNLKSTFSPQRIGDYIHASIELLQYRSKTKT